MIYCDNLFLLCQQTKSEGRCSDEEFVRDVITAMNGARNVSGRSKESAIIMEKVTNQASCFCFCGMQLDRTCLIG